MQLGSDEKREALLNAALLAFEGRYGPIELPWVCDDDAPIELDPAWELYAKGG